MSTKKEKILGKGFGGFDLVPYAQRVYECRECGNQITTGTNHRIDCYPVCTGECRQILNPHTAREVVLKKQTAHKFIKDLETK